MILRLFSCASHRLLTKRFTRMCIAMLLLTILVIRYMSKNYSLDEAKIANVLDKIFDQHERLLYNIVNYNSTLNLTNCDYEQHWPNTASSPENSTVDLKTCCLVSNRLMGQFKPILQNYTDDEIEAALSSQNITLGGKWSPPYCSSHHRVAIIIPYRRRPEHLKQFLLNMHPLFARQELTYGVYIVEPDETQQMTFNRGMLFNIGFIEANRDIRESSPNGTGWDCFAFHDVDLISEDDRTLYACYDNPMHMAHRINVFNYEPIYKTSFGGVTLLTRQQYEKCNGYSNLYFGWGGEDDDHYERLIKEGYHKISPPAPLGRYFMHTHVKDPPNPIRFRLLNRALRRYKVDGVNSVKYKLVSKQVKRLYTKFVVSYNEQEVKRGYR